MKSCNVCDNNIVFDEEYSHTLTLPFAYADHQAGECITCCARCWEQDLLDYLRNGIYELMTGMWQRRLTLDELPDADNEGWRAVTAEDAGPELYAIIERLRAASTWAELEQIIEQLAPFAPEFDETYCDHCADELDEPTDTVPGNYRSITELPCDIDSANAGESAQLCTGCFDAIRVWAEHRVPGSLWGVEPPVRSWHSAMTLEEFERRSLELHGKTFEGAALTERTDGQAGYIVREADGAAWWEAQR